MSKTLLPLLNKNEDVDNGIPIIMYDIKGKEHSMTFKHWESRVYVLKEGWNTFCQKHSLREHKDFVKMWMFRHVQTMLFHLFEKTKLHSWFFFFFFWESSFLIKFNCYQKNMTHFTISKELYLRRLKYEPYISINIS